MQKNHAEFHVTRDQFVGKMHGVSPRDQFMHRVTPRDQFMHRLTPRDQFVQICIASLNNGI